MLGWVTKKQKAPLLVFIVFLLICWLGLAYSFVKIFIGISEEIPKIERGVRFLKSMIDVYLEIFLKKLIFLWILIHLQGIVRAISRNEPFDARNPARIRKIALGPFAWAVLGILSDCYWARDFRMDIGEIFRYLRGSTGQLILFGVAILIIAKAFEMGIEMQRDQNLTI